MKKKYRLPTTVGILASVLIAIAYQTAGGGNAPLPDGTFAITQVRVFDGKNTLPKGTVLVEDGVIVSVGTDSPVPEGVPTIDGTGQTLIPGLIDSHTHTWGNGLERALVFGVTTHLDMFTDVSLVQSQRREQDSGQPLERADLFSAGILATAPGGHGTQFGMTIPTLTGPAQAESFVADRVAEGSDYLKIVSEDGSGFGRELPTLDRPTIAALIESAERHEMLSVVHATILSRAQSAVEDGVGGLAHLFSDQPATSEFIALMVERNAFLIPTLTVVESTTGVASGESLADDEFLSKYLTKNEKAGLAQSFPGGRGNYSFTQQTVQDLHAAGVPILAGSDAPNPGTGFGASLHRELELLVAAGLSPSDALASATSIPAAIFSLEDRGQIRPGLRADLLLVEGDPTVDITTTRNIRHVWKAGHLIPRLTAESGASAPKPRIPASGVISDFSESEVTSTFGVGWRTSTDSLMGGTSSATLSLESEGDTTSQYLLVKGHVQPKFAFPWAGAIYYPGSSEMGASDLSDHSGVRFRARSRQTPKGGSFRIMLFAESLGMRPAELRFELGPEWQELEFRFADFGTDGGDLTGILLGAGPSPGQFDLQVDDVRLITID